MSDERPSYQENDENDAPYYRQNDEFPEIYSRAWSLPKVNR